MKIAIKCNGAWNVLITDYEKRYIRDLNILLIPKYNYSIDQNGIKIFYEIFI